jgi:hypothetical protein
MHCFLLCSHLATVLLFLHLAPVLGSLGLSALCYSRAVVVGMEVSGPVAWGRGLSVAIALALSAWSAVLEVSGSVAWGRGLSVAIALALSAWSAVLEISGSVAWGRGLSVAIALALSTWSAVLKVPAHSHGEDYGSWVFG